MQKMTAKILKKEIIIVEVKSNKHGIKLDKKWKNYLKIFYSEFLVYLQNYRIF